MHLKHRQTLEQERAAFAWAQVRNRGGEKHLKDYRNLAKSAPALVAANGLLPTVLFYKGKGKPHHLFLLEDLSTWLNTRALPNRTLTDDSDALVEALIQASPAEYRQATDETLQLLRWIRQFVAAIGNDDNAS
jgi:CRISPR-associated protein Cmr5